MHLKPATKITFIYLLIGLLWILLSDRLLVVFFDANDKEIQIFLQSVKGFFYVVVTAFLLYGLIKAFYRDKEAKIIELELKQQELSSIQKLTKTGNWEYQDFKKIVWSSTSEEIFEVDASYKLNNDFLLFSHLKYEEQSEAIMHAFTDAEKNGNSFDFELEIVTAKGNEKWIKFVGKPVLKNGKCTKIIGSYQDITEIKKTEDKIRELSRLYHVLTEVNKAIVRTSDEHTLLKEVCDIAVTVGLFRLAWIGKVDVATQEIVPFVHAGFDEGYLAQMPVISVNDTLLGKGPTGSAIREGKHFVCNDIATNPSLEPWKEAQLKRGYRSSISLPICKFGQIIGAFSLYAASRNFFSDQEIELLKDATADISYALENMEKELLRKKAEADVLEALERYNIVSKATSDTIWDWDIQKGTIVYNQGMFNVFGYKPEEIKNTAHWREMNIHRNNREQVIQSFNEIFLKREHIFQAEYRFCCFDGTYKYVLDRAFVKYDESGNPSRVIGTMQDITHEKEDEIKVEKAVINTQEQERQKIGMELHDNVNQILSVSLLHLGMVRENSARAINSDHLVTKSENYIKDAINEIRRLSHELAPVSFKDISIQEAFEILINTVNVHQLFHVKLGIDIMNHDAMPDDIKINLYRILQEQMNNIVKHAQASEVEVTLFMDEECYKLVISDNGKGFDRRVPSKGIGFENIRRRAKLFSGEMKLSTAPGKGCEVFVEIPVRKV